MKCEKLETHQRKLQGPTAQIYKDLLYVYGIVYEGNGIKKELWCFDLSKIDFYWNYFIKIENQDWRFRKTSGEEPGRNLRRIG